MINIKINGANINIKQMNQYLAISLENALYEMQKDSEKIGIDNINHTCEKSDNIKCLKCNRNCKTRGVDCKNGHWVHYKLQH